MAAYPLLQQYLIMISSSSEVGIKDVKEEVIKTFAISWKVSHVSFKFFMYELKSSEMKRTWKESILAIDKSNYSENEKCGCL